MFDVNFLVKEHSVSSMFYALLTLQVMSAGRSADGREVQIPLQQVAPSLATPLSVVPPSHRPANPWPPSDSAASQGKQSHFSSSNIHQVTKLCLC